MVRGGPYQPLPVPRFDPNVTRVKCCADVYAPTPVFQTADEWTFPYVTHILTYRGDDKSLARPTSRCILPDG